MIERKIEFVQWRNRREGGVMKFEQLEMAETVNDMRIEINRASRYDPMINAVLMEAEYRGWSGEDKYAYLAYTALRELQKIKQNLLDINAFTQNAPGVIVSKLFPDTNAQQNNQEK